MVSDRGFTSKSPGGRTVVLLSITDLRQSTSASLFSKIPDRCRKPFRRIRRVCNLHRRSDPPKGGPPGATQLPGGTRACSSMSSIQICAYLAVCRLSIVELERLRDQAGRLQPPGLRMAEASIDTLGSELPVRSAIQAWHID
jgi:hypothetical protein